MWRAVVAIMLLFPPFLVAEDVPAILPRYSLPVGRRLTYSGESHFPYQNGSFDSLSSVQLTVVAKNADGSSRVIVRNGEREVQNRTGQPATQPAGADEDVSYIQADVMPDGRCVSVVGGLMEENSIFLPPLPADQVELAGKWKQEPKIPGATQTFASAGPIVGGQWTFTSSSDGIFKRIYGITDDDTYHFDIAKGTLSAFEFHTHQTYGFTGSGVARTHLDSDQIVPADEYAPLAKDLATFIAAKKQFDEKIGAIEETPENAKQIVAAAKAAFSAAGASVTTADIKSQFANTLASVDREVLYEVEEAQRIAEVLNKAAYEFSADDLDGHPHKLSDYRGKIVVLDFWYRGCGWCIRAMPSMKQVVDDFRGKPVVFLGMNTDKDSGDAKFVIDAMQLNYPTLKSDFESAKKFNVQGYPTLLIIDGAGVLREFHMGYSFTLRTDIDAKIQSLLDKKP